jgi:hypothetical protein
MQVSAWWIEGLAFSPTFLDAPNFNLVINVIVRFSKSSQANASKATSGHLVPTSQSVSDQSQ